MQHSKFIPFALALSFVTSLGCDLDEPGSELAEEVLVEIADEEDNENMSMAIEVFDHHMPQAAPVPEGFPNCGTWTNVTETYAGYQFVPAGQCGTCTNQGLSGAPVNFFHQRCSVECGCKLFYHKPGCMPELCG